MFDKGRGWEVWDGDGHREGQEGRPGLRIVSVRQGGGGWEVGGLGWSLGRPEGASRSTNRKCSTRGRGWEMGNGDGHREGQEGRPGLRIVSVRQGGGDGRFGMGIVTGKARRGVQVDES